MDTKTYLEEQVNKRFDEAKKAPNVSELAAEIANDIIAFGHDKVFDEAKEKGVNERDLDIAVWAAVKRKVR